MKKRCRLCLRKALGTYRDQYGNRYYLCYFCAHELGYEMVKEHSST